MSLKFVVQIVFVTLLLGDVLAAAFLDYDGEDEDGVDKRALLLRNLGSARGFGKRSPSGGLRLSEFGARGFGKRDAEGAIKRIAMLSDFGARGFGKRSSPMGVMNLGDFGARGFGKRMSLSDFGARGFGRK